MGRIVVVFGGRRYGEIPPDAPKDRLEYYRAIAERQRFRLFELLDCEHQDDPIEKLIHGGAKGADKIGAHWARTRGVEELAVLADWKKHGQRYAGHFRNAQMAKMNPDFGVKAPGGGGTADMASRLKHLGIKIVSVEPEYDTEDAETSPGPVAQW